MATRRKLTKQSRKISKTKKKQQRKAQHYAETNSEVGLSSTKTQDVAIAISRIRSAKTRKGKKLLEARLLGDASIQRPKISLIYRGQRCNATVRKFLEEIHALRKPYSVLHNSRWQHEAKPFEQDEEVERLCCKADAGFFLYGSSSKKKPFRAVFGRIFGTKTLDAFSFTISSYVPAQTFVCRKHSLLQKDNVDSSPPDPITILYSSLEESNDIENHKYNLCEENGDIQQLMVKGSGNGDEIDVKVNFEEHAISKGYIAVNCKPLVVCQGMGFETITELQAAKNLLCEFFGLFETDTISLKGLCHVVVLTAVVDKTESPCILFRHYQINLKTTTESRKPLVHLTEIGPSFDLVLDRARIPSPDRWKAATLQNIRPPTIKKSSKKKSTCTNTFGETRAKVFIQKQDLSKLYTPHFSRRSRFSLKPKDSY